jgi:hypothetical protein
MVGNDFGCLHRRLVQMSILYDLTLDPCRFRLQHVARGLQFGRQLVDFIYRGTRDALKQ